MTSTLVERVVRAASLAPSLHNSQPWRFVATGGRLDLLPDRERSLPVIDPEGRWSTVSCGAALLNAVVAARAAGRACRVELRKGAGSAPLATLHLDEGAEPGADDIALARAIPRRRTHREPFAPGRLPPQLVDELRHAAAVEGCWTHTVDLRADVARLSALLRAAESALRENPAYRDELRAWVRELGAGAPDGVPAEAIPAGGPDRAASDVWQRDFAADDPVPSDGETAAPVERPLVMVLGTSADDRLAWLRAGMATQRVLLTLTAAGAAASPLTHVLDLPDYRSALSELVGIDGHPQMLLRMGRPATAHRPTASRRTVEDILRVVSD